MSAIVSGVLAAGHPVHGYAVNRINRFIGFIISTGHTGADKKRITDYRYRRRFRSVPGRETVSDGVFFFFVSHTFYIGQFVFGITPFSIL